MSPSPYHYSSFIPFHLSDPAGILFFGNVFPLVHQAFEHFIIHYLHFPWKFWFENEGWIVPIKQAEANYFHPVKGGEDCLFELSITNYTTSSFTLSTLMIQQELCCKIKTVHVFCSRLNKQKIPIPPDLLPLFQKLVIV